MVRLRSFRRFGMFIEWSPTIHRSFIINADDGTANQAETPMKPANPATLSRRRAARPYTLSMPRSRRIVCTFRRQRARVGPMLPTGIPNSSAMDW